MKKLPPVPDRGEIAPPDTGHLGRPRQRPRRPAYESDEPARYQRTFRWKLLAALLAAGGVVAGGLVALVKNLKKPDNIGEVYNAVTDGRSHKEQALKQQLMAALGGQPRVTLPNGMTVFIDEDNGDTIFAQLVNDDGYFYEMFVSEKMQSHQKKIERSDRRYMWFRSAANREEGFPRQRVEDLEMDGRNINGSSYATEGQGTPLDQQEAAAEFDRLLEFFSSRLQIL